MLFETIRPMFHEAEGVLFYSLSSTETTVAAVWRRGEIKFYLEDGSTIDEEEEHTADTLPEFQRRASQMFRYLQVQTLMEKACYRVAENNFENAAVLLVEAYHCHPVLFVPHVAAQAAMFAPHTEALKPFILALDADAWDTFAQYA